MQKILTLGKGVITPTKKLNISVNDVMVMDTAESSKQLDIRLGTSSKGLVLRQALRKTKVSSIPMPSSGKEKRLIIFHWKWARRFTISVFEVNRRRHYV